MVELPITIYVSNQRPHSNYSPRFNKQKWLEVRSAVEQMFAEGLTQKEILKSLQDHHDFKPSTGQLVLRMAKWGLTRYRTKKTTSSCSGHDLVRNSNFTPAVSFVPGNGFDAAKWCSNLLRTMSPLTAGSVKTSTSLFLTPDHMVAASLIMGTPLMYVRFDDDMRQSIELEVMQHLMRDVSGGISALADSKKQKSAIGYRTAVGILLLTYISFQHGVEISWIQRHLSGFMSVCQSLGITPSIEHDLFRYAAALDNHVSSSIRARPVLGLQSDSSEFIFQKGQFCPIHWCIRNNPFASFGLDTTMVQFADVNSVVLVFPENNVESWRGTMHSQNVRTSNVRTFAFSKGSMVAFGKRPPNNPMLNTLLEEKDQHLVHASTERGATGILSRIRYFLTG